ncbi:tRNA epoxyqueuosine(34) reductase QueG [Fulvivirgaceae bacterium BMA10]|uniref:Epoxyqueuosine reductase n=1 Tax=Splendidivirga corallicola TaxID=3051826 RepID=A0ABT8KLH3_9BACT|nr:tRNA epoxyqueuosine(34) reductase QueG [Fulvivirgaceae bacterium BMA10]
MSQNTIQSNVNKNTKVIKQIARRLGFDFCGISKATFLEEEAPKLEQWLNQKMHGTMHYMDNHFDKRLDPRKLVDGAKSVVSLIYNYFPNEDISQTSGFKIAKYAYGKDYHFVIKDKLRTFLSDIRETIGEVNGRAFVDSAPVMERVWAKRSGIGWIGKNSLLLNRNMGSFFFLAELVLDIDLISDGPIKDFCGSCSKCMDACPTDAIPEPYIVDASKCISYFTIELKEAIPEDFKGSFENWVFGCDICQDVCPWNRFSRPHHEDAFVPHEALKRLDKKEWTEMTREVFNEIFRKSAVKRTKYEGFKRNISFVSKNERAK